MGDWRCELGDKCPIGLNEGKVSLMEEKMHRLMHTFFGDGNGNEGLQALMQRREGQLTLLIWLFGPSSILGLIIGIIALIMQAKGH